jgi:BirA family biotin operon repressor/biotin-[acetyl-CoA-carboxylase] ligase
MDGPGDGTGRGRKLGGVLIETVSAGAQRVAVIGIGLNIRPFSADEVNTGFATLQELDASASAPAVLMRIALPLVQALQRFERDGFAAFAETFSARDLLRGLAVRANGPETIEGIARGISPRGGLLVDAGGRLIDITSGEVSVRLAMNAEAGARC